MSVEASAANAALARQFIDHAGFSDEIRVIRGRLTDGDVLEDSLVRKTETKGGGAGSTAEDVDAVVVEPFDFVFVDHDKAAYLADVKYLMVKRLVVKGSVIVADNILFPGAPAYRKFVTSGQSRHFAGGGGGWDQGNASSSLFETTEHFTHVEHLPFIKDCMTVSTMQ